MKLSVLLLIIGLIKDSHKEQDTLYTNKHNNT